MQVMYKRCCGIDVHKMKIVCCLKKGNKQEIKEFSAETKELKEIYNGNFNCIRLTINQILAFKIKILDWIEKYPLQIIHFPTYYTELDSMDKGWREAFGMNFCKDLRKALIRTGGYKLLFRFRILQIKEKCIVFL